MGGRVISGAHSSRKLKPMTSFRLPCGKDTHLVGKNEKGRWDFARIAEHLSVLRCLYAGRALPFYFGTRHSLNPTLEKGAESGNATATSRHRQGARHYRRPG